MHEVLLVGSFGYGTEGGPDTFRRPSADLPTRRKVRGRHAEGRPANLVAMTTTHTPIEVGASARLTRTVTRRDIELFTEISGDRNPIHHDDALASRSRFGGIVVQGGVTSGLLNALVAEQLPGPGSVFLEVAWRFLAPVRPGDVITAAATVLASREDKPVTTLATSVTNQDDVVVLDGTAVVWRDPTVSAATSPDAGTPARADHRNRQKQEHHP